MNRQVNSLKQPFRFTMPVKFHLMKLEIYTYRVVILHLVEICFLVSSGRRSRSRDFSMFQYDKGCIGSPKLWAELSIMDSTLFLNKKLFENTTITKANEQITNLSPIKYFYKVHWWLNNFNANNLVSFSLNCSAAILDWFIHRLIDALAQDNIQDFCTGAICHQDLVRLHICTYCTVRKRGLNGLLDRNLSKHWILLLSLCPACTIYDSC